MTREQYTKFTKDKLIEHGLKDWSVRLNMNPESHFLGLCSYKDKAIILNAHHLDIHPELSVLNIILHEIAHALCPGMGHNPIWAAKAREIGCDNTIPCSNLSLSPQVIDAIRSGATVEMTYEEQVIRTPAYKISRLQDRCPECGKIAKEKSVVEWQDKEGNTCKLIILECLHTIKHVIPKGTAFDSLISNGWQDRVKNCKHDWDKNKCNKCGEFKLFDFQVEGARFTEAALIAGKGALIADEMGLGKTVQSLATLKFHPELFPALFIVKSGIKFQWAKEIIRWLGPEYAPQVIETGKHYIFPNFKSYIISYDLIRRLDPKVKAKLDEIGVKTIILDECQQIKNVDSTRTAGVRLLAKPPDVKVIGLSGTFWKNRGSEAFPMLNMADPIKFHSFKGFRDRWVDTYYEGPRVKEGGIKNPKEFREHTKNIMIRRERTEVMKELPLVNRMKLHFEMGAMEKETYDDATSDFVKWYNEYVQEGKEDEINALELIAQLSRMRHIIGLAKIPATLGFVDEFVENEENKKLVIFVHHIDVGNIIYNELVKKYGSDRVKQLKGGMDSISRFEIQEAFNASPNQILVASTLAAGEGLNLQTCADCILHERQWNPANEEQAEGRFIRIGQTSNTVNATYVEVEDSVEMHFDKIVETKRRQFHAAMNKGEAPAWNESSLLKELAQKIVETYNKNKRKKRA